MKLSIGVIKLEPVWEILLNQVGVSYCEIKPEEIEAYPLVIISGVPHHSYKNIIVGYLKSGGNILTGAQNSKHFFDIACRREKIRYLYSWGDEIFYDNIYCEINQSFLVPVNATNLANQDGINTVRLERIGKGNLVVLPEGFFSIVSSFKIRRKNFYSANGKDFPTERVSQISKGNISHILVKILESLFHKRNLPLIKLWQFPDGHETIFGFRIDTDFAKDEDILNLYEITTDNDIRASWFVETSSRKQGCEIFKNFDNQELGLHCFRHKVYRSEAGNADDINKGLRILEKDAIKVKGYSAPFGEYRESLALALEKSAFEYSSEFGYAYDSLPLQVRLGNSILKVLQIPIHPISVGRLYRAGHSEEDMIDYFCNIIQYKKEAQEPVMFYTHPAQKRLKVFDNIFKRINELKIPVYIFAEYSSWWKKRISTKWEPELIDNKVVINTNSKDDSIWMQSSFPGNKSYLSPLNATDIFSHKKLQTKQRAPLPGFNPEKIYNKTLKLLKQDILFTYKKLKY